MQIKKTATKKLAGKDNELLKSFAQQGKNLSLFERFGGGNDTGNSSGTGYSMGSGWLIAGLLGAEETVTLRITNRRSLPSPILS